jgi:hypothetical protein
MGSSSSRFYWRCSKEVRTPFTHRFDRASRVWPFLSCASAVSAHHSRTRDPCSGAAAAADRLDGDEGAARCCDALAHRTSTSFWSKENVVGAFVREHIKTMIAPAKSTVVP